MLSYGQKFSKHLKACNMPITIELIGDVGVGKTTFVRGIAQGLGIKEPVTSPSFTISKTYPFGNNQILAHYDFYRLSNPGIMSNDLEESVKNNSITIIEWGNEVKNLLPEKHIKINLIYNDDNSREVTIL